MDGQLNLKNLKESVSVIRDQYGIPHINAKNTKDAYRALGFVVASERLFQMEMQRRMSSGELSEIFGKKTLESDKLFRTLGLRSTMREMIDRKIRNNTLNLEMWSDMEAFYDGVNQYQFTHQLPIEFSILKINPRPFSALDGYAFIGLMGFSFGAAISQDPLLTKLKARLGEDLVNDLRNELTSVETLEIDKIKKANALTKRVVEDQNHYPVSRILAET